MPSRKEILEAILNGIKDSNYTPRHPFNPRLPGEAFINRKLTETIAEFNRNSGRPIRSGPYTNYPPEVAVGILNILAKKTTIPGTAAHHLIRAGINDTTISAAISLLANDPNVV